MPFYGKLSLVTYWDVTLLRNLWLLFLAISKDVELLRSCIELLRIPLNEESTLLLGGFLDVSIGMVISL